MSDRDNCKVRVKRNKGRNREREFTGGVIKHILDKKKFLKKI